MVPPPSPLRSLGLVALTLLFAFATAACEPGSSYQYLRVVQVSFTNTVVNAGETITLSAVVEGTDSPSYVWSAEAGEFATPAEVGTDWTAPETEQLVQVTLTVSDTNERTTAFSIDIVVGSGVDHDGDGFSLPSGDCDDTNAAIYPGAPDVADGIDNDCDGFVDEDFLGDSDGDGWSVLAGDCDDTNFYVFESAPEFADGVDNDCDGSIDEDMDETDDDGDGYSEADGDCDDTTDAVYPGATEIEDDGYELDNDCDGYFAENPPVAVSSVQATDGCSNGSDDDSDGWIDGNDPDCVTGFTEIGYGNTDCNDSLDGDGDGDVDSADGQCGNGMDNDEADSTADDCMDGQDNDSDGWADADDPDCVALPFNESIVGTTECNNGVDDDADGNVDADDVECDDGFDGSETSADPDDCVDGEDGDLDGWTDAMDPDCRTAPFDEIGVGTEECNDGVDNDGDGLIDTADSGCGTADGGESVDTCEDILLVATDSWDPDEDPLSYYWYFDVQPINSDLTASSITNGTSVTAQFTPDVAGFWTVGLIVSDGQDNSEPALAVIDVEEGSCAE